MCEAIAVVVFGVASSVSVRVAVAAIVVVVIVVVVDAVIVNAIPTVARAGGTASSEEAPRGLRLLAADMFRVW